MDDPYFTYRANVFVIIIIFFKFYFDVSYLYKPKEFIYIKRNKN